MALRRLVVFLIPLQSAPLPNISFSAPKMPQVLLFASLHRTNSLTRQVSGTDHDLTIGKISLTLPSLSFTAAQLPPLLLKVCCLSDAISPVILLSRFSYRFHSSVPAASSSISRLEQKFLCCWHLPFSHVPWRCLLWDLRKDEFRVHTCCVTSHAWLQFAQVEGIGYGNFSFIDAFSKQLSHHLG